MRKLLIILTERNRLFLIFLFCLCQIIFLTQVNAQTISVSGKVTTGRFSVHHALVTFIDNADTTNKFSVVTNSSGSYQLNLVVTSVKTENIIPTKFELEQNYPNPFSSLTDIPYQLKNQSDVEITIYDILGRQIKKFSVGVQSSGRYNILWDGKNNFGEKVSTGIYFYQLRAGTETQVKKMIFGTGIKNMVPSPTRISPSISQQEKSLNKNIINNSFNVRIENTDSTSPSILTKVFENILVENDTTLDFSIDKKINLTASIYFDSTRQLIRGFGAANILQWRPDMTESEIETAFDTGNGQLGFTILRLRVQPDSNQWATNIPSAKKAHDMGAIIIASPWSPPASMKSNNNLVGGELKESSYSDYAAHLNSFVEYMSNNDAPIYAISVQNEPDVTVDYESCDWNTSQMKKFVKENGAFINTRIIVPESFNFNHTISDSILNDSAAAANIDIIGGHIYGGGLAPYPLALNKGKEIWMTEHLDTDTSWSNVLATGKEINDCLLADMSAYIWWYIVRFYGPIHENGNVTKRGYIISQFSRFIRPGFERIISTENPQPDVYVSAYKQGSNIVIVALNMSSDPINQAFNLEGGLINTLTPYVTSQTKNCITEDEINISNNVFNVVLDPSSITTFVAK